MTAIDPGELRLQLKPGRVQRGYVDGGWWPHSEDAAAEFPALIAALDDRVGPVGRVGYDLETWGSIDRKVLMHGHIVRFEGFHTVYENTVYENTVYENTVHENTVHENTVHENTVHENTVHENTVHENTVTLIGPDSRRVSLLVVPPSASGDHARSAMHSAADADSTCTVADMLGSN